MRRFRWTLSLRAGMVLVVMLGVLFWVGILYGRWQRYSRLAHSLMNTAQSAGEEERLSRQQTDRNIQNILDDTSEMIVVSQRTDIDEKTKKMLVESTIAMIEDEQKQIKTSIEFAERYARIRIDREALARRYEMAAGQPWRRWQLPEVEDGLK